MATRDQLCLIAAFIGMSPFLFNGLVNSHIYTDLILYWSFEILIWVVLPGIVVFVLSRSREFEFRDLGFTVKLWGRNSVEFLAFVCLLFAPLCYLLYVLLFRTIHSVLPSEGFFQYSSVIPDNSYSRIMVVAYFAITAGVVEELYFRGMLFKGFSQYRNHIVLFVGLSPVLFSLVHWESGPANLIATYLFGLFLAIAYLVFQNIWPLIIGHTFTDAVWFS